MARKSKEQLEREKELPILERLLDKYHPSFENPDEMLVDLGYDQCSICEVLLRGQIHECQVCSDMICEACGPDHSFEETGV